MERLLTVFGEKMDKTLPLNDYPRPQFARDSFQNLNGEWDYAIYDRKQEFAGYQGKILVPFSPETILSGVERVVKPTDVLYYCRKFDFKKTSDRVLLHFGAVDYFCQVCVNGKKVGENKGGYYPFTFEITSVVHDGENEITVTVTDPSDTGSQARGKQSSKRGGIWYTPQSGIWQTVWIEQVGKNYLKSASLTPDIDAGVLNVTLDFAEEVENARLDVYDGGKAVASVNTVNGKAEIKMGDFKLWSPETPHLYDLEITTSCDKVRSYFGMRKFGIGKDENGIARLMLNNKPYFHNGLLDQGYWSDGMYTPPTDEAMIYDIQTMKDMGFNMLRKHIKIEPMRWYYHCDRLGMLVWQDMINGGGLYKFGTIGIRPFLGNMMDDSNYKAFSREDEHRLVLRLYKKLDSTRIIDHASGWHDQGCGDLRSLHIYFTPIKVPKDTRPVVLSEFGGLSLQAKGHMYNKEKFFGYRRFYEQEKFEKAYKKLFEKRIIANIPKGLAASVYTEVSDVEDECNGLLSYDRKVVKIDMELIKDINARVKL